MGPIEMIKQGIQSHNWQSVVIGYNTMTGGNLPVPSIEEVDLDDITITSIRRVIQEELDRITIRIIDDKELSERLADTQDVPQIAPAAIMPSPVTKEQEPSPGVIDESGNYVGELQTEEGDKGYYGNKKRFITGEHDSVDAARNQNCVVRKHHRPPPKRFKVSCNECGNEFESDRKGDKEVGQKCPGCLRATRN